jgi:hypothetical protein
MRDIAKNRNVNLFVIPALAGAHSEVLALHSHFK